MYNIIVKVQDATLMWAIPPNVHRNAAYSGFHGSIVHREFLRQHVESWYEEKACASIDSQNSKQCNPRRSIAVSFNLSHPTISPEQVSSNLNRFCVSLRNIPTRWFTLF
jgi:hypothetical protein